MSDDELWRWSATALTAAIRDGEVTCVEVMQAHLGRIEAVNPAVNAIVTLDAELALRDAAAADRALGGDGAPPPLHGLPMAIKDLEDTAGMRTTYGSPIFA
ncbi:MAG TPA: amidase family protein, partial [Solirubrobacteraceae bacterium]|nr:amidase family protein [Solirubrobacteraceae bacterium]